CRSYARIIGEQAIPIRVARGAQTVDLNGPHGRGHAVDLGSAPRRDQHVAMLPLLGEPVDPRPVIRADAPALLAVERRQVAHGHRGPDRASRRRLRASAASEPAPGPTSIRPRRIRTSSTALDTIDKAIEMPTPRHTIGVFANECTANS